MMTELEVIFLLLLYFFFAKIVNIFINRNYFFPMLHKTKGIVLHRFKYSDSSFITHIYTEKFGKQSYIIFRTKSKKGRSQINLLQPFFLLDLNVYNKKSGGLQKIKDFSIDISLTSIPFSIKKSAIVGFLSEILYRTLSENEPDNLLYNYLKNSILILDLSEKSITDFHILFLMNLCKYLGIAPKNNFSKTKKIFDMQSGKFIIGQPSHNNFMNEELTEKFRLLFDYKLDEAYKLNFNKKYKNELLHKFIKYFQIHFDKPYKINSLQIFREVFRNN